MTSILSAIEALAIVTILSVGFISSMPRTPEAIEAIDQESERNTAACDAEGGEWNECTYKEMKRVFLK